MFWKFVRESLWRPRNRRRALGAVIAVALGTAVAAAMLSVSLDVGDKMGREMRSLGANIVLTPAADSLPVEIGGIDYRPVSEGAYIAESVLPQLKEIFWRNNIIAFAPFLYVPVQWLPATPAGTENAAGEEPSSGKPAILVGTWFDHSFATSDGEPFHTGIRALNPTWSVEGEWIEDSAPNAALASGVLGRSLAERFGLEIGDRVRVVVDQEGRPPDAASPPVVLRVQGILTTGGAEDSQLFASLALVQSLARLPDQVRKVQVSALIKPEDELSRRDPASMTPEQYDRWYCSPYISSILHQIREVLPGTAALQIRPVAETQGNMLGKLTFLMGALAVLALLATVLSLSSLASWTVLERRQEIGLMKAMGAPDWLVAGLFLGETACQGIAGGALGFFLGQLLARSLGQAVFGAEVVVNWVLLPLLLLVALGVSFVGVLIPLWRAARIEPAVVLRGE